MVLRIARAWWSDVWLRDKLRSVENRCESNAQARVDLLVDRVRLVGVLLNVRWRL